MSREAIEAVQDHSQIDEPTGRNVFQAIGRFVPADGSPGWVSYRTIAEVAHCDKDTAWSWAKKIEAAGELKIETRGQGRGTETWFTILLPFDKPKHGAVIGDIKRETSQSGGDNNGGDVIKGMSEQIAELSQQIAELSQQIQKLSQRTSRNVPIMIGTVTNNQRTLTKTLTEEGGAPPMARPFVPSPVRTAVKTQAQERSEAIMEVCGYDTGVPAHVREADNAAAQLAKYPPDIIKLRYGRPPEGDIDYWNWYRDDWRGRDKLDQPTPKAVVETIGKARQPSTNGHKPAPAAQPKGLAAVEQYKAKHGIN